MFFNLSAAAKTLHFPGVADGRCFLLATRRLQRKYVVRHALKANFMPPLLATAAKSPLWTILLQQVMKRQSPSGTQPKGIGDNFPDTAFTVSPQSPSGTQPKGIGDDSFLLRRGPFAGVPKRDSAERHWRLVCCDAYGFIIFVPKRDSAERHWRHPVKAVNCERLVVPKRDSAERHWRRHQRDVLNRGRKPVPKRDSAERHWRPASGRGASWWPGMSPSGTQPKGIGDFFDFICDFSVIFWGPQAGLSRKALETEGNTSTCRNDRKVPKRDSAERHWRPFANEKQG